MDFEITRQKCYLKWQRVFCTRNILYHHYQLSYLTSLFYVLNSCTGHNFAKKGPVVKKKVDTNVHLKGAHRFFYYINYYPGSDLCNQWPDFHWTSKPTLLWILILHNVSVPSFVHWNSPWDRHMFFTKNQPLNFFVLGLYCQSTLGVRTIFFFSTSLEMNQFLFLLEISHKFVCINDNF